MQTTRRLAVLTVLAAVLIAAGALFLIVRSGSRSALAAVCPGGGTHLPRRRHRPSSTSTRPRREELTALPGLGPRKAAALVAYREAHGPFATLADAAAVKGISLRMTESWAGLAAANH